MLGTFLASAQPLWAAPLSSQALKSKLQQLHQQQVVTKTKLMSHQKTLQTNLGKVKKQRQVVKQQRLVVKKKAQQAAKTKVTAKVSKKTA